jgi:CheY-like chemotaxis protein
MPNSPTVELPDLPPRPPSQGLTALGAPERLPMRGITILAVEDSRFASEALRLMCQRSGARLRRAETLAAAQSHLKLYRPDIVIIDLGLPDGRGEALIRELLQRSPRPRAILGTSGDPQGRALALAAGADGYLEKPLESLHAFQEMLIRHVPEMAEAMSGEDQLVAPDRLALRDDLQRAAAVLATAPDRSHHRYIADFLTGIARHARDPALAAAAEGAGLAPTAATLAVLRGLIDRRLSKGDAVYFASRDGGIG